MKKINITLAAIISVMAISCNKEIVPETSENPSDERNLVEKTFYASYGQEDDTKVAVGEITETAVKLVWQENDNIAILTEENNTLATATAANIQNNSAKFTTYVPDGASTYYAVYPASAVATTKTWVSVTSGNTTTNALRVTIPHVQKAVDNSFDPKAYVATAKTTDTNLSFEPIVSAIKFQLGGEATKIDKIVFKGKNETNIAGTGCLKIGSFTSHSWISGESEAFSEITLEKPEDGFKSGTDYYILFRADATNKYNDGIELFLYYADKKTVKKASSKAALFTGSNKKGAVKDLKDISLHLYELSLKEYYDLGYDIQVGDVILNKNINGDAKYVSNADETAAELTLSSGVNFIEGKFKFNSTVEIKSDTYYIGIGSNSSIAFNAQKCYHKQSRLGFKNIALDATGSSNNVITNTAAQANMDEFILDNCKVATNVVLYHNNDSGYNCKKIYIVDSDIQLTAGCDILKLTTCTSTTPESITIKNSLLYANGNTVAKLINLPTCETNITLENNTVFNLHAGTNNGLIHSAGSLGTVSLQNNLFSFYALYSSNEYIIKGTATSYTTNNNHFDKRSTADTNSMYLYNTDTVLWGSAICKTTYPYTSNKPGAGASR